MFSIYAVGATDFNQLLKLPLLVKHYVKHKQENPRMSIGAFIKMHYIDKQPFDADYQQDMQLPFKQHDDYCLLLATVLPKQIVLTQHHVETVSPTYTILNDDFLPSLKFGAVFKPPRA